MSARTVVLLFAVLTLSAGQPMFTSRAAGGADDSGIDLNVGVYDAVGKAVNLSGPGHVLRISGEAALAPGAPPVLALNLTLFIDGMQRNTTGPWPLVYSSDRALLECFWTPGLADIGNHVFSIDAVDGDARSGTVNCTASVSVQILAVVLSDVEVTPSPALEGDDACITAVLFNYGAAGSHGRTVAFSEGFQRIGTVYGVDVPAGGWAKASCRWVLPRVGGGDGFIVLTASVDGSEGTAGVMVRQRISRIELGPVALGYGLEAGQELAFDIAVRNNGTGAAQGLQAEFLEDGQRLCITALFDLGPGGKISVPVACTIFGPENMTHDFTLRVGNVDLSTKRLLGRVPTPADIRLSDFFVDPEHMDGKPPGSAQVAYLNILLNNTGEREGRWI